MPKNKITFKFNDEDGELNILPLNEILQKKFNKEFSKNQIVKFRVKVCPALILVSENTLAFSVYLFLKRKKIGYFYYLLDDAIKLTKNFHNENGAK